MTLRLSFVVAGLALVGVSSVARAADLEPVGTWLTEDGRAKIRTEKCGETSANLCGFVVWLKDPLTEDGKPRTDPKNPDPAKRSRPSLGMELMDDLTVEDDPAHYKGQIYNAENGKMYDITVAIEAPTELQVKGCLLKFLCGSQTWTKVADLPIPTKQVAQSAPKKATGTAAVHKTDTATH